MSLVFLDHHSLLTVISKIPINGWIKVIDYESGNDGWVKIEDVEVKYGNTQNKEKYLERTPSTSG